MTARPTQSDWRHDGNDLSSTDGRVFVLTHRPPQSGADTRITFISDPIQAAVAIAEDAAADKDVAIFGATLTRQCLQAGLLDELVLHVAPILLGRGVRLFGGEDADRIELERVCLGEAEQLTDLRFRVVKPRVA